MGRAKITLKPILNARSRKITCMQRKKGLIKKVSEFFTMCRVETCLIVYDDNIDGIRPLTWPQDPTMVRSIIENYERQRIERPSKIFDIQDFFDNRKNMIDAEISKLHKQTREIKYPTWDSSLSNMGDEQLKAFIANVNATIEACDQRINVLKNMNQDEANINSIQNMAHASVSSSHSSQLNFQDISQSHFIPTHMEPLLNYNNERVNFTNSTNQDDGVTNHEINVLTTNMQQSDDCFSYMPNMVLERTTSSQSSQLNCLQNNFQSKLITVETLNSLKEKNEMIDFSNQVDVPPYSINQLDGSLDWSNQHGDFEWTNGPIGIEGWNIPLNGDLVGRASQTDESILHNTPVQSHNEQQGVALNAWPPSLDGFHSNRLP